MINLNEIDIQEVFNKAVNFLSKTTKKQRIIFAIVVVLLVSGYFYGKNWWQKYTILKKAKSIVATITKNQQNFLAEYKRYKKFIFADEELRSELNIFSGYSEMDMDSPNKGRMRFRNSSQQEDEDYTVAQSGDFYIENDSENGCVVLKYKKNTTEKTTFYASFKDGKIFCQGKRCLKETKNNEIDLCYKDGVCFDRKQAQQTERPCGDGNGVQKRKCTPSCENGTCEEWSACICNKGFEWTGTTCKQSQTENDCTEEQCFNGIYCEDKEILEKQIGNGSCNRSATCQKNSGWEYSPWQCSCNDENFCSLEEQCVLKPKDKSKVFLPKRAGSCTDVYFECKNGEGWKAFAKNCVCDQIGYFWDTETKEAKCSECTNKPEGAVYTSSGKNKDDCTWKCEGEYQARKGTCAKPNGQYLCAKTELQICTDEFSKNRKIQKDAKKTNEGQLCYVEDKDNILFYNQKEKTCQICQCIDLIEAKNFI